MANFGDLYDAIAQGNSTKVSQLLSDNHNLILGDEKNPPPLHWAIYHDQADVAEVLIANGASMALRDTDRSSTPLEYAAVYARKQAIQLLIAKGANPCEGLAVAEKGARGGFVEYEELPTADEYQKLVQFFRSEL